MIFRTKSIEKQQKKEKVSDEDGKQGRNNWKNIVGSMRPLTLQQKSPAVSPSPTVEDLQALSRKVEREGSAKMETGGRPWFLMETELMEYWATGPSHVRRIVVEEEWKLPNGN
nr:uncharacterized protein LOC109182590 [Ipomoea batatas]